MIRTCALDSHSLTMDNEMVRVERSHGIFMFDADDDGKARKLSGWITVCDAPDGCNTAAKSSLPPVLLWATAGFLATRWL